MATDNVRSRREVIKMCGMSLLAPPLTALAGRSEPDSQTYSPPTGAPYEGTDEQLLEEIQRASFDFSGTKRARRQVR